MDHLARSVLTYPALLATGLAPTAANVTNTVALAVGGVGGAIGSRPDLTGQAGEVRRLAPAYDLLSVTVYEQFRTDRLAFRLAGERAFDAVRRDHFRRLADAVDTDPEDAVAVVDATVDAMRTGWPDTRSDPRHTRVPDAVPRRSTQHPAVGERRLTGSGGRGPPAPPPGRRRRLAA